MRRKTPSRPELDCGKELYYLVKRPLKARDADSAVAWMVEWNRSAVRSIPSLLASVNLAVVK